MLDRDLQKHAGEFGRYLRNNQYEVTDTGGVLFPRAAAVAAGGAPRVSSGASSGEWVR